jgi:hypothetical protein
MERTIRYPLQDQFIRAPSIILSILVVYCSNTPPLLNGVFGELPWDGDLESSSMSSFGKSLLSFGDDSSGCSKTPSRGGLIGSFGEGDSLKTGPQLLGGYVKAHV